MIRRWYILTALAILTPAVAVQAGSPQFFRQQLIVPIDDQVYSDCSREWIHIVGNQHVEVQCFQDQTGAMHCQFVSNTQDVSGTGLSSGASYQDTGVGTLALYVDVVDVAPFIYTVGYSSHLVGTGTVPNLVLNFLLHLTVNANGTLTAFLDDFKFDCR